TVAMTPGGIQEHGPHAIRRAPDGSYTVIAGNHATIADDKLDPGSLVVDDKDAQFLPYLPNFGRSIRQGVHSGVYRWDPTIDKFTVLFGGNRNAYDYAYNLAGEIFLFDSDMEWDINMPWYREVRTVHGIPGGNFGYRDGSGKYPAYYLDSLPPVREVGRGSPVGVEFYTSYVYSREFFDNLFEADWSRGRLLYTALTPNGATFRARSDRAEFVHGEPFNITDVEVGPDGMLYFTTGGRNTTGGVWRLRYKGKVETPPDMTGILAVVRQPQPLSSWGWAAIERVKGSMGASFATELERLVRNASAASMDRTRAIYEMQRHATPPSADLLTALLEDRDASVRAAVVYVAGVQGELARAPQSRAAVAAAGLKDADPVVRRRAAEALVRMGQSPDTPSLAPVADIYALLNDADRFVRWAGRIALERTARSEWQDRALKETNVLGSIENMIALVNTADGESLQPLIDKQFAMMKQADMSLENRLRLFRAFQYTTTGMQQGLTPAEREQLHGLIVNQFPAEDERLNRELALMLAYAGQPQAISKILAAIPTGDDNQPLQLHYLYALRTITEGWTQEEKTQLAELLGRTSTWRGGAQFINFVGQMFDAVQPLFATPAEQQVLYDKAPDFSPLTPEQLAEIQAKRAQAGRGGRGGRGAPSPLAARRAGRVISRQEMLEEAVFQPQQNLDAGAGRKVFEASCASCHQFGSLGTDHGVSGLNLTASPLRSSKYTLLEAVMLPNRTIAPAHETTMIGTTDGRTVRGLVVRESAETVSLLTAEAAMAEVPKAQIKSRVKEKTSIMTEALADTIGQTQLRNLAEFLTAAPPGSGQPSAR
ncbi:MAG: HEAT repeat domain-containing protein, partial [Vicinamibacterales bacterium]